MRIPISIGVLCLAQFVVTLDVTIVAIALPAVGHDLHAGASLLQWIIGLYTLVFGGLLVVTGRLVDRFGQRRMFVTGLAIFTLASLGCGLSTSMQTLLTSRAVQGVGAALLAPAALALLSTVSPNGRSLGMWTAAAAGGGASGWLAGGLLASGPGWPWVFLVNVPIGVLAIGAAGAYLPEAKAGTSASGIGVAGMATATGGWAWRCSASPVSDSPATASRCRGWPSSSASRCLSCFAVSACATNSGGYAVSSRQTPRRSV